MSLLCEHALVISAHLEGSRRTWLQAKYGSAQQGILFIYSSVCSMVISTPYVTMVGTCVSFPSNKRKGNGKAQVGRGTVLKGEEKVGLSWECDYN